MLALTCPTYHETPNAPFARLSERLQRFSRVSDALRSFELKGAAMYLQMTLHGPVERCLLDAYRPALLLTEHHSLIATLAYGALYTTLIRKHADASLEAPLREQLDAVAPGSYDEIVHWAALHAERIGTPASVFELGLAMAAVLQRPRAEVIVELTRRYGTGLPDVRAAARSAGADRGRTPARRGAMPKASCTSRRRCSSSCAALYLDVAEYLRREHPEVADGRD